MFVGNDDAGENLAVLQTLVGLAMPTTQPSGFDELIRQTHRSSRRALAGAMEGAVRGINSSPSIYLMLRCQRVVGRAHTIQNRMPLLSAAAGAFPGGLGAL